MGCDWGSMSANVCQRLAGFGMLYFCMVNQAMAQKAREATTKAVASRKTYGLLHTLEGPKQGHHGNCDDECNEVEGETYAHKVGKLVVAHTLHNEVGLIANGGAKTG